jgi:hypothetical protein
VMRECSLFTSNSRRGTALASAISPIAFTQAPYWQSYCPLLALISTSLSLSKIGSSHSRSSFLMSFGVVLPSSIRSMLCTRVHSTLRRSVAGSVATSIGCTLSNPAGFLWRIAIALDLWRACPAPFDLLVPSRIQCTLTRRRRSSRVACGCQETRGHDSPG